MRTRPLVAVAATLILAGAGLGASVAAAAPAEKAKPKVTVVAKGLVGPLSVAQAPDGTRYWADAFAGVLYKQDPRVSSPSSTRARERRRGCLRRRRGRAVRHRLRRQQGGAASGPSTSAGSSGHARRHLQVREEGEPGRLVPVRTAQHPQVAASTSCPRQVPQTYPGVKDTHPYAVPTAGDVTYVADAGMNAVLALSPTGKFSTVAALKPAMVEITAAAAAANQLPAARSGRPTTWSRCPPTSRSVLTACST